MPVKVCKHRELNCDDLLTGNSFTESNNLAMNLSIFIFSTIQSMCLVSIKEELPCWTAVVMAEGPKASSLHAEAQGTIPSEHPAQNTPCSSI